MNGAKKDVKRSWGQLNFVVRERSEVAAGSERSKETKRAEIQEKDVGSNVSWIPEFLVSLEFSTANSFPSHDEWA